MDKLWSPWRSKYIESFAKGNSSTECIFCVAAEKKVEDPENLLVKKGKLIFTLLNLYPYNNGHLMIVPFRHVSEFGKLTNDEASEIMWELHEHIHFHIVPRWIGDTNFMPVLGEVKVISQDLKDTKLKLLEAFKKLV